MRLLLVMALAALLLPSTACGDNELFQGVVLPRTWRVIDGDTIEARVAIWPKLEIVERIRLLGWDTPELHKGPPCERDLAKQAMAITQARLSAGTVILVQATAARDDFGRLLANVVIDGAQLADSLVAVKLARPFGTKTPWC